MNNHHFHNSCSMICYCINLFVAKIFQYEMMLQTVIDCECFPLPCRRTEWWTQKLYVNITEFAQTHKLLLITLNFLTIEWRRQSNITSRSFPFSYNIFHTTRKQCVLILHTIDPLFLKTAVKIIENLYIFSLIYFIAIKSE